MFPVHARRAFALRGAHLATLPLDGRNAVDLAGSVRLADAASGHPRSAGARTAGVGLIGGRQEQAQHRDDGKNASHFYLLAAFRSAGGLSFGSGCVVTKKLYEAWPSARAVKKRHAYNHRDSIAHRRESNDSRRVEKR